MWNLKCSLSSLEHFKTVKNFQPRISVSVYSHTEPARPLPRLFLLLRIPQMCFSNWNQMINFKIIFQIWTLFQWFVAFSEDCFYCVLQHKSLNNVKDAKFSRSAFNKVYSSISQYLELLQTQCSKIVLE